ncbi:hypothetical protein RB195_003982 [Necator americanus]|uniref:Uncharacterized protein n=1 Tax=Necator americanus TaxID=51031 RepID=A0ABR1DSA4_NECAM
MSVVSLPDDQYVFSVGIRTSTVPSTMVGARPKRNEDRTSALTFAQDICPRFCTDFGNQSDISYAYGVWLTCSLSI